MNDGPPLLISERKELKDKIRQLQEDIHTCQTATLQNVTRIINTSEHLTEKQKEFLIKEVWK